MQGQNLGLKQRLEHKLSPQQIQLMKLLQLSIADLDQRVQEELEVNPALEEDQNEGPIESEDVDRGEETEEFDDYLNQYLEDDPSSYRLKQDAPSSEEEEKQLPIALKESLYDKLEAQLMELSFETTEDEILAKQILGSIDEDGYIRRDVFSIQDDLLFLHQLDIEESRIEKMIKRIQQFDPPGVGARDLRESLMLQLHYKLKNEPLDPLSRRYTKTAYLVIRDYFDAFSKRSYEKLLQELDLTREDLKEVVEIIKRLNPKPAATLSATQSEGQLSIKPDFVVHEKDGELILTMPKANIPDLKISEHYKEMLLGYSHRNKKEKLDKKTREAVTFIKQKISNAQWFIDAIVQRNQTLMLVMNAIMQMQKAYFLSGDPKKIAPMRLKDVAQQTDLDESTISRVVNSKFVQTDYGTKKLKYFFSEGMQNQEGEEVSTIEIKSTLKEIVEQEDKRKPYSDEKLKSLLEEKGYKVARRTVAKYREQLSIPVARLRKNI